MKIRCDKFALESSEHDKPLPKSFAEQHLQQKLNFILTGRFGEDHDEDIVQRREQGHDRHRQPGSGTRQIDRSVVHRHKGTF